MDLPYSDRAAARGDARADRAQRPHLLLHPPDRLSRLRADGPQPARGADRRLDRDRGRGAPTSARTGTRNGIRAKVSSWERISPRSLIPQAKASGPVPQQRAGEDRVGQGGLRRGDPARRARPRLRGLRREHLRRARRRDRTRRRRRPRSSTASTAARSSRSRATSATRCSSATSPAPSSTSPTRSSSPAPPPSSCRCARSTTTRSAPGDPGEITRALQAAFQDALHGRDERYREWHDVVAVAERAGA